MCLCFLSPFVHRLSTLPTSAFRIDSTLTPLAMAALSSALIAAHGTHVSQFISATGGVTSFQGLGSRQSKPQSRAGAIIRDVQIFPTLNTFRLLYSVRFAAQFYG